MNTVDSLKKLYKTMAGKDWPYDPNPTDAEVIDKIAADGNAGGGSGGGEGSGVTVLDLTWLRDESAESVYKVNNATWDEIVSLYNSQQPFYVKEIYYLEGEYPDGELDTVDVSLYEQGGWAYDSETITAAHTMATYFSSANSFVLILDRLRFENDGDTVIAIKKQYQKTIRD